MLPGMSEWLIIFFVAVLVFGPSKLPDLGRAIGEFLKEFKKGIGTVQNPNDKENEERTKIHARKDSES